ncbi:hypothetical protein RF11_09720 [Thelohanellus kitauei]|uniref:Uncharacterized protein n=1 Tax=Thelohanellus kitauei TaxID=669202 RepID=A0A0C2MYP8_THEKT|nr:hypothetical protein RF11_09720 [Thelohanellus kitauei]
MARTRTRISVLVLFFLSLILVRWYWTKNEKDELTGPVKVIFGYDKIRILRDAQTFRLYWNDQKIYEESNKITDDLAKFRFNVLDCQKRMVSNRLFRANDERVYDTIYEYLDRVYPGFLVIMSYSGTPGVHNISNSNIFAIFGRCFRNVTFENPNRTFVFSKSRNWCVSGYYQSNEIVYHVEKYSCDKTISCLPNGGQSEDLRRIEFCESFFSFPELCRCTIVII